MADNKIERFSWKPHKNFTANLINYMSHPFYAREEHMFLGFVKTDHDWIGVMIEDECFIAVHVFKLERELEYEGDLYKKKPYVLMFYGSDNSSYFKRFKTKQGAINHFTKCDVFDYNQNYFWYNS